MQLREDGPCYVDFETREAEDRQASVEAGHYVSKDVHFIIATPPGGNLTVERVAEEFIAQKRAQNDPHAEYYERAYRSWLEGQEEPLEGTPIRSWPSVSPSQVKAILGANIKTVEDLARADDGAIQRVGMGARGLKEKAKAWLEASANTGKVSEEIVSLRRDNKSLEDTVNELTEQVKLLQAASKKPSRKADN